MIYVSTAMKPDTLFMYFFYCKEVKLFWKFVEEIIRNTIRRNYEFKPFHVVYNCRDTIQETNSIYL